jgi:hypothetical protein
MVLGGIHGNTIKPGVKGTVTPETGQGTPGFEKGFLGHVLHFIRVTHITADQGENTLLIFAYQHFKGTLIAGFGFLDQLFV